jgi:hypothetical protein
MDVSDAGYYIDEKKNKVATWGTPIYFSNLLHKKAHKVIFITKTFVV